MTVSFDASPLTEPVDAHEVRMFAKNHRTSVSVGAIIAIVLGAAVALFMLVTVVPTFIGYVVELFTDGHAGQGLLITGIAAAIIAGAAFALILALRYSRVKRYRLHRFAEANSMQYIGTVHDPDFPGMIFHEGDSRVAQQVIRGERPRLVEFGNFQYSTGSGKNRTTHEWGYVAVKLDVPLPNIVLDASGNNSLFGSNLPNSFNKRQRLGLEGDFDKHFSLYCPEGYERDALYLFTPDIMAHFIDNVAQLDVEIVDYWLFLYTSREASTLEAATWAWLFGAVDALMTKLDQWGRWRDERLIATHTASAAGTSPMQMADGTALPFAAPAGAFAPPPGVAPQGRRLKQSVPWVLFILFGLVAAFGLISQFF